MVISLVCNKIIFHSLCTLNKHAKSEVVQYVLPFWQTLPHCKESGGALSLRKLGVITASSKCFSLKATFTLLYEYLFKENR